MKVSVVTPTLNGVEYLRECIESSHASARNGIEVEHMIVDAGSTDGTVELARSLGATVLQGKDRGIFDAINKGSFAASGELLGFLGADDVLLPGGLEAVVAA
jgi:glycosyltransferase involved in cell wall biosynthesis